jgi:hypothetical protein
MPVIPNYVGDKIQRILVPVLLKQKKVCKTPHLNGKLVSMVVHTHDPSESYKTENCRKLQTRPPGENETLSPKYTEQKGQEA